MKIITITLGEPGDRPDREGWVIVGYSAAGGGRTDIGTPIIRKGDDKMPTWEEVAANLLNAMGRNEWPDFIKAKASGNSVRLSVPPELDDTVFSAQFNPTLDQTARHEAAAFVVIQEEKF